MRAARAAAAARLALRGPPPGHRCPGWPGGRRRSPRTVRPDRSHGTVRRRLARAVLAALSNSAGASLPRLVTNASWARTRSTRACWKSLCGPVSATVSRSCAASNAPVWTLACAAASAREARCAGSSVSIVARSRNAAAAASPPRARARPAERSSSAATSSSGPGEACARCQARRSGSSCGSVTSAKARCISCLWWIKAERYAAERTSGCRNRTPVPNSARPASTAGAAASAPIPTRSAARHTSERSPVGSAAASSSSRRVWSGSASIRCTKFSSMLPASGTAPGRPNPPARSACVSPRGSSSKANGLPRVSDTIRSRTRSSIGPGSTESSRARASVCRRPPTASSGNPARSPLTTRDANTRPTDSAPRRRATKARTCAEARSSHWWSSTRHTSGRSSATSDSRLRTARPTRNRSGADPELMPNAVRSASRRGVGSVSR